MQKEELKLQKRLSELSNISYQRGIAVFSDFLNLNELNILHITPKHMFRVPYQLYGGHAYAERQMVSFLPDALYMSEIDNKDGYPISLIQVTPLHFKYTEELTHRDYLGAVLNLGIDRSKIGDIIVLEHEAVIFVQQHLADFIADELVRVRHTTVQAKLIPACEFDYTPAYKEIKSTVASVRLDSILSLAFPMSRTKMTKLIEGAKVYVNGKLITTNSYQVKDDDIISVRGLGKLAYRGMGAATKKGRYYVTVHKYI